MIIFTDRIQDNHQGYDDCIENPHFFIKARLINVLLQIFLTNTVTNEYSSAFLDYIRHISYIRYRMYNKRQVCRSEI